MAVAIGTDTDATLNSAATSTTVSHTVAAGTDCLVVRVGFWNNFGVTISSVTYGGVALTLVGANTVSGASDAGGTYRLLSPTVGTANVVVTFSGTGAPGGVNAANLSGVNTTTPTGTFATATGTSNTPSVAVSGATDDLVLDVMATDLGSAPGVGAGQTAQYAVSSGGEGVGISSEPGAASVTMSWSRTGSADWSIGGVAFKAAGAGPTSYPFRPPARRQQHMMVR